MPSVLLLREPDLPFEPRRLTALLSDRIDAVRTEILWPHRLLPLARGLLRRRSFDVVHAFGRRALALAALSPDAKILFTATRFPNAADIRWLRAALRYRDVRIVCGSDVERRRWVGNGVPIDRCRLVRPGVSMALPAAERQAARLRFGFDDSHRVLFAPLPAIGNGRSIGMWTGNLLNILDPTVKSVAWTDGGRQSRDLLHSLRDRLINPDACVVCDDADPTAAFAASDAIVLPTETFLPPTIVALSMASGRPIVAQATPQTLEALEDHRTALLTPVGSPKGLADRATDVFTDAPAARAIGDRARAAAYERFALSRLLADYRTLYAGRTDVDAVMDDVPAAATG